MCTFMLSKIVKVYGKREVGTKIGGGKRKRGKRNGVKVGWENRAEGGGGKGIRKVNNADDFPNLFRQVEYKLLFFI